MRNLVASWYNMLGRRVSLESKDFGRKEWRYDSFGNLIETSDSVLREKGHSIGYEYGPVQQVLQD